MTDEPSKDALAVAQKILDGLTYEESEGLLEPIALAIDKAVAEEREACANMVREMTWIAGDALMNGRQIEAAIRNRAD